MSNVIVYAEIDDGLINDISLQAIAVAAGIAAGQGGQVVCIAAGSGIAEAASGLFAYGADAVYIVDDAALEGYLAKSYAAAISGWIASQDARLALFPASTLGGDLAAAVAASLDAPCALDCDSVESEGGAIRVKRDEFDRKVMTCFEAVSGSPLIVSLRDGIAEVPVADESRGGAVESVAVALDDSVKAAKVLARNVAKKTVNLKDAKIIVAGGAGIGTAENFALVKELADKLGAEIGATRAVVDAGWVPADHQIGQTGATVRPEVYIGIGISGAVQHRVGMCDADKIIAINTDANAPIFHVAHYKIIGDFKDVVPKLIGLIG